jgi:hypothetical protein
MNNIPEEKTTAAGTGTESGRGEGSILVALLRGAGELRGSMSGELHEHLLKQPPVAAWILEAPSAGEDVEPKLKGRRLKHTSKRFAGGSAGERQLTTRGLHGDVAAIRAAK